MNKQPYNKDNAKYLLIGTTSVYIPGDERSRTNPGHGYPESTEYFPTLTWFKTLEDLEAYLNGYGGRDLIDPEIYELAGRVKVSRTTVTTLLKE